MPVHYLTALPCPKWVIKRIDKMRRDFLWKGEEPENVKPGTSLVNWQTICVPRDLGGLGILDLERFSSALRVRWLWIRWHDRNRPWNEMDLPCNTKDMQLFQACTQITIGNGQKIFFWKDNWLEGMCPKEIAPNLFWLARRKNKNLQTELDNNHWVYSFREIDNGEAIHELVQLGNLLSHIQLSPQNEDSIIWKRTSTGTYSAQSAYKFQFITYQQDHTFRANWKAQALPKQRFFGWLVLHKRALTVENLLIRHWECDWICLLCRSAFENTKHLFRECDFTRSTWNLVAAAQGIQGAINQTSMAN